MSFIDNKELILPKGSLILVTGSSGFIASNVVVEALNAGYKIRGTARSEAKAEKTRKVFNSPNYDVVVVPEMEPEGAYDEAVKGVDAIIHMSSPLNFSPNPKEVVPPAVKGATSILRSAAKEPKVKRFVFTSSSTATSVPTPGKKFKIDSNSWNTEVEEYADFPPPYLEENAFKVYSASKTKAERAVWDFIKSEKPQFTVNFLLPAVNIGRVIDSPGETGGLVINAFKGNPKWDFYPQYMIDVVDCARLHLIALVDGSLDKERILAFYKPWNWNVILDRFRKLFPDRSFPANRELGEDLSEVDNALGAELLRKWYGQDGYTDFDESLRKQVENVH